MVASIQAVVQIAKNNTKTWQSCWMESLINIVSQLDYL
jgi:hypothetical protein